ncbi:MAG: hypothetical protein HC916_01180 [Coleofasciculaceae cyanobacterium SM2_1_6]|nr:hypothetical protein [Coleofasciculaceae cyanobacterium SM2_1_6]
MKIDNPFDRMLENYRGHIPGSVRDAAVYVTDTLDLAWAAAQSVFEEQAKPEHALKILELFLLEANKYKLEQQEELKEFFLEKSKWEIRDQETDDI